MSAPNVQAAEQLLQSLPNPSHIKEIWVDITWKTPTGNSTETAIVVVALLMLAIIAIAVCITVYNVKRVRR